MKPLWITKFSPSHAGLFREHFLPSWEENGLSEEFDLRAEEIDVHAGAFGEAAFNEWGRSIMRQLALLFRERLGQIVVISGCDMRFYANVAKEILEAVEKYEMVAIHDVHFPACGDLNAFVVTERIIALFEWAVAHDTEFPNQEFTLNEGIRRFGIDLLSLPGDFWTVGMANGGTVWNPGDDVRPPPGIKLHHANFTVGAPNKRILLAEVRDRVAAHHGQRPQE